MNKPRIVFEVEKVMGVSSDGSYQVQWAPAWVSKFHLVGCEHLIQEFLQRQQQQEQEQEKKNSNNNIKKNSNINNNIKNHNNNSNHRNYNNRNYRINHQRHL